MNLNSKGGVPTQLWQDIHPQTWICDCLMLRKKSKKTEFLSQVVVLNGDFMWHNPLRKITYASTNSREQTPNPWCPKQISANSSPNLR